MNSKIVSLGVALLFFTPFMGRAVQRQSLTETEIRQYIQDAVEKEKIAPGIAVGLIDEKGTQVICYGTLKRKGKEKVDGDTIFEIGSMTTVSGSNLAISECMVARCISRP